MTTSTYFMRVRKLRVDTRPSLELVLLVFFIVPKLWILKRRTFTSKGGLTIFLTFSNIRRVSAAISPSNKVIAEKKHTSVAVEITWCLPMHHVSYYTHRFVSNAQFSVNYCLETHALFQENGCVTKYLSRDIKGDALVFFLSAKCEDPSHLGTYVCLFLWCIV